MDEDLARVMALLAQWTGHRILAGTAMGVPQQEETLTESILLDLSLSVTGHEVRMFSRDEESQIGADWVWWIQDPNNGLWLGLLVQAKKFKPYPVHSGGNYKIGQRKGQQRQVQTLTAVSRWMGVTALYALYNPLSDGVTFSNGCDVAGPVSPVPLDGVTFLHSLEALRQVRRRSAGSENVNLDQVNRSTIPWSCLFSCRLDIVQVATSLPLRIRHLSGRRRGVDVQAAQRNLQRLIELTDTGRRAMGGALDTLEESVRAAPPDYVDGGDALTFAFERGLRFTDRIGDVGDDDFQIPDRVSGGDVLPPNVRGVVVARARAASNG